MKVSVSNHLVSRPAGSSLLETVIALFILCAAMIVSFQLFTRATAWQGEIELRATALTVAQDKIAELELAAADLDVFRAQLSSLQGASSPSAHPAFEVVVAVAALPEVATASTQFELPFQGAPVPPSPVFVDVLNGLVSDDRRMMPNSMLVADVTVRLRGSNRMRPLVLTTLLREPPRMVGSIVLGSATPGAISYQQSSTCSAQVLDTDGEVIEDATLEWNIRPITTFGTAFQSRDGSFGALQHAYESPTGMSLQPPPGQCKMAVSTRIEGATASAVSDPVTLNP